MKSKAIRLGIILSAIWTLVGGYWSHQKNTFDYQDMLSTVQHNCTFLKSDGESQDACVDERMKSFNSNLHELGYWKDAYLQTAAELLAGLIAIWAVTLGLQWALKAKE